MIKTGFETRVKIHQIVENQLPEFILSESPKAAEFLKQYYISQEIPGGSIDIVENLDQYLKLDNLTPEVVSGETTLESSVTSESDVIVVESTKGFPLNWGLLKIDDEIITYSGITTNTFTGCVRGFSGITTYYEELERNDLVFSTSEASSHESGSDVKNLSALFLQEFYKKVKYSLTPGLEELTFVENLDVSNFIKEARSFYASKGTKESFRILFNILYGVTPRIVDLEKYLIKPSSAEYIRRETLLVERISGDPLKLVGQTIRKSTDPATKASVSEVEIISKNNLVYYKLSLFVGFSENALIEGTFTVPGKTRVIGNIPVGSEVISVDSTVEFPKSGTVFCGGNTITYTDKTINQFLGCSGITSAISPAEDIRFDEVMYGYEDGDLTKKVEVRITGVLSKFVPVSDISFTDEGEVIYVKNLGEIIKNPDQFKTKKQIFSNTWIYNTSVRYQVKGISGSTFLLYSDIDKSSLKVGDTIEILRRNTQIVEYAGAIVSNINKSTKEILLNNLSGFIVDPLKEYDIRRNLNKATSSGAEIQYGNNVITSDVQNVYNENDEYMYVASNSLPSYPITTNLSAISLGEANGDRVQNYDPSTLKYSVLSFQTSVPFITGDEVYYKPENQSIPGLDEGLYYVRVLAESNKIKLYTSRSFIPSDDYIEFSTLDTGTGNHTFTLSFQNNLKIGPQKSLKKFPLFPDIQRSTRTKTEAETVGILINGVEINSYKSNDRIYFGPLEDVNILNTGSNYDVINPPLIEVSSPGIGTTALVQPVVTGSVKEVFVDPQDFDIDDAVSVTITGGNGSGCILKPITSKRYRELDFSALPSTQGGGLDVTLDDLSFLKDHNIKSGQALVYDKNGSPPISIGTFRGSNDTTGIKTEYLENGSVYYAQTTGPKTIRLYRTQKDFNSGINTIGFTTASNIGFQKFRLLESANTVTRIDVLSSGEGYSNRKLRVSPSGISTSDNTINFVNHGFNDGEKIVYSAAVGVGSTLPTIISGLSTSKQYQVIKITNNKFRLADAGIGGTITSNYERKNYIKFQSKGTGYQVFEYPPISISVNVKYRDGISGIITATPIIRGVVNDIYLYQAGTNYGSSILNLHKKPLITVKTGKDAQLKTYIKNGKIDSVQVLSGGREYYSTPDLVVSGEGTGAKLRAVIVNNAISQVIVINPGVNYVQDTTSITVKSAGSELSLDPIVRSLRVNTFARYGADILKKSITNLKYCVVGYSTNIGSQYFDDDGSDHSPIIGWALDGNPIYGPYGYEDPQVNDSPVKLLSSSYVLNTNNIINRPSDFSSGFFIEDYAYNDSGDLDESNGRFCKTPEFPLGTYAYFTTLKVNATTNTIEPVFPYFLGDSFRSNLLDETYIINQDYDFKGTEIIRNTLPYNTSDQYSGSDFIVESNELINQTSIVESVLRGSVDRLDIITAGDNYKIGDAAIFNNNNTGGSGASAQVSLINGREITSVETSTLKYQGVILIWKSENEIQGYISTTHSFNQSDNVYLSGISTSLKNVLGRNYKVGITTSETFLYKAIPSTTIVGVITDIYVSSIPENMNVGDVVKVSGTETMTIINKFDDRKILRVTRNTSGYAHTLSAKVELVPTYFSLPISTPKFESKVNDIVYFNPSESVGVGTSVGFSTSVTYTIGIGELTGTTSIPIQSIRLPNHPFQTNQKVLIKKPLGEASLFVQKTPADSPTPILSSGDWEPFYVVKQSDDHIGIVTQVGLTTSTKGLFFASFGSNNFGYAIRSDFTQVTSDVNRVTTLVSLSTSHGLKNGDIINLDIKSNQSVGVGTSGSIRLKYDTIGQRILVNQITFSSSGINTAKDSITIARHGFSNGDKIYYKPVTTVASGLQTGDYYVYVLDENTFNLTETLYDNKIYPPSIVNINSVGGTSHTISLINPQLNIVRNNDIVFDVKDSTLSGYNLKFYYDSQFKNEFISVGNTANFVVSGVGTIGISSDAKITLRYDAGMPQVFFYALEKSGFISTSDLDVTNASKISYIDSLYNGRYSVFDVTNDKFKISLTKIPESTSYSSTQCESCSYTTFSKTASGGIGRLSLTSGGVSYKKLPVISGFESLNGTGAQVYTTSNTIGKIDQVRIVDPGFEYPSDVTLRPQALVPSTFFVLDTNIVKSIDITYGGRYYQSAPDLILANSEGIAIDNGIITPSVGGSGIGKINIIEAPNGLDSSKHTLFAVNNTNGFTISKVDYDQPTGIVTCTIQTPIAGYSQNIVNVGDKIFVEGVEKYGTSGNGFNAIDNKFKFYDITAYRNTNPAELEFNLTGITTNAGIAVTTPTFASFVRYEDYPRFDVITGSTKFSLGEKLLVFTNGEYIETDLVVTEDRTTFIKSVGRYELEIGDLIIGTFSGTRARVDSFINNNARFEINYSARQDLGWLDNIGKLNEDYQVLPDNDYYQSLSYTIKSPIEFEKLINPVNSLLHTVGLKNFSDTEVKDVAGAGVTVTPVESITTFDFINEDRVDTIYGFDLGVDNNVIQGRTKDIKLKNRKLAGYIECRTNNVLKIDDISPQFSNSRSSLNPYIETIFEDSFARFLIQIIDPASTNIQATEVILVKGRSTDLITFEKSSIFTTTDQPVDIEGYVNEFGDRTLRFYPTNYTDIDYDIKILKTYFGADTTGIGTINVGFINLSGSVDSATIGITTEIISAQSNKLESMYVTAEVYAKNNEQIKNIVELYITHDGTNTYQSDYFFDTINVDNNSYNPIGTFRASLNAGTFSLTYENPTYNGEVVVRSRVVGFGTTAVGVGTYRSILNGQIEGTERSFKFESDYRKVSIASTSIFKFDKTEVSTIKSLVRVSYGNTSALHQVLVANNNGNCVMTQYPFVSIGSTSGIGTFGVDYSTSPAELRFYRDPGITATLQISSFNEVIYSESDFANNYPSLEYGKLRESMELLFYNAVNGSRSNKTTFKLTSDGVSIFSKKFSPSSTTFLNPGTGIITIERHFFNTGEKLIYTPGSTFIGIGSTAVGINTSLTQSGISTDILPSEVYAIRIDEDRFRLATRQSDALAGIYVTFTSLGSGNAHELQMSTKLEKTLITIDGVVQYPLAFTPVNTTLQAGIGDSTSILSLGTIRDFIPDSTIKVDDEIMRIVNVGFATTSGAEVTGFGTYTNIEVTRAYLGSISTSHGIGSTVRVYSGNYNIGSNSIIYFTSAPTGKGTLEKNSNNVPYPRAVFGGRVYLRKDYSKNRIFDDISTSLTGVGRTYTTTVSGLNTTGIQTGSAFLFLNGIFQTPTTANNPDNVYTFKQFDSPVSYVPNSELLPYDNVVQDYSQYAVGYNTSSYFSSTIGISSIIFSGITSSNGQNIISTDDVNQNQLPRGGVIISIGSTQGLGFAPLYPAQIGIVTNASGGISTIVAIGTYSAPTKVLGIVTGTYDNATGIATFVLNGTHNLRVGDPLGLSGLRFSCNSWTGISTFNVNGLVYDRNAGIVTITVNGNHGLKAGKYVRLANIILSCPGNPIGYSTTRFPYPAGIGTLGNAYPQSSKNTLQGTFDVYRVIAGTAGTTIVLNVGVSTVNHTYVSGGTATVGVTTNIFPYPGAGPEGGIFRSLAGTSGTTIVVNGGISSIPHTYTGLGSCSVGIEWKDYNYGSGYYGGPVSIAITSPTGNSGSISAVVGAGGTLIFTINSSGTGYAATNTIINIKEPSYENLPIVGVSRVGLGSTTDSGLNTLLTLKVGANDNIAYDGVFYDAANLIDSNKQLIAEVAVGRMLSYYPTFSVPTGTADCVDDIKSVLKTITHNLRFGGNDKVWDAANLYRINPALLYGEEQQAIFAFREARDLAIQAMRNQEIIKYRIVSGRFYDASNLIIANRTFIADIAVGRMLAFYTGFTIPGGNQECKDDIMAVTNTIVYNLRYGGNSKVWDAANIYKTNPTLLAGEEAQSIYAFNQARDIMIQVMRNETVTISGMTTATQYKDLTIAPDPANPDCQDVASAITSFVGIITTTISTGTIPTSRTEPPNVYTNETQIIDSTVIGDISGTAGVYATTDIFNLTPNNGDCANVASAIGSFVGIITTTIATGTIPTSKTVAPGSLFQVTNFSISRPGYGFRVGDVFKPVGLVTDSRLASPINDFSITVLQTYSDQLASWELGEFDYIDSIKPLQNGVRKRFPLAFAGKLLSFETNDKDAESSLIKLENLLLIFINNVLQVPENLMNLQVVLHSHSLRRQNMKIISQYSSTMEQKSLIVSQ